MVFASIKKKFTFLWYKIRVFHKQKVNVNILFYIANSDTHVHNMALLAISRMLCILTSEFLVVCPIFPDMILRTTFLSILRNLLQRSTMDHIFVRSIPVIPYLDTTFMHVANLVQQLFSG